MEPVSATFIPSEKDCLAAEALVSRWDSFAGDEKKWWEGMLYDRKAMKDYFERGVRNVADMFEWSVDLRKHHQTSLLYELTGSRNGGVLLQEDNTPTCSTAPSSPCSPVSPSSFPPAPSATPFLHCISTGRTLTYDDVDEMSSQVGHWALHLPAMPLAAHQLCHPRTVKEDLLLHRHADLPQVDGCLPQHTTDLAHRRGVVGLLMENCADYIVIWLGLLKVGYTVSLLPPSSKGSLLLDAVVQSDPIAVICSPQTLPSILQLRSSSCHLTMCSFCFTIGSSTKQRHFPPVYLFDSDVAYATPFSSLCSDNFPTASVGLADLPICRPPREIRYHQPPPPFLFSSSFFYNSSPQDKNTLSSSDSLSSNSCASNSCFYIFTSGTTSSSGNAKPAIFSHGRVMGAGVTWQRHCSLSPADRLYVSLPLCHGNAGVVAVASAMRAGACLVIRSKFSATKFWREVVTLGCTGMAYVGDVWGYLMSNFLKVCGGGRMTMRDIQRQVEVGGKFCGGNLLEEKVDEKVEAREMKKLIKSHQLRFCFGNGLDRLSWLYVHNLFRVSCIVEHYGQTEMPAAHPCLINSFGRPGACGYLPPSAVDIRDYFYRNSPLPPPISNHSQSPTAKNFCLAPPPDAAEVAALLDGMYGTEILVQPASEGGGGLQRQQPASGGGMCMVADRKNRDGLVVGEAVVRLKVMQDHRAGRNEVVDYGGYVVGRNSNNNNRRECECSFVANVFQPNDVFYRSGDILGVDGEGYYFFIQRTGDTYRRKGENIGISQMSSLLQHHCRHLFQSVHYYATPLVFDSTTAEAPEMEKREELVGMAFISLSASAAKQKGGGLMEAAVAAVAAFRGVAWMVLPPYAYPVFVRVGGMHGTTCTHRFQRAVFAKEGFNFASQQRTEQQSLCGGQQRDFVFFNDREKGMFVPWTEELCTKVKAIGL
eukprot:GHVS01047967.1.p1 GENE.GHVS01047967.1~~GHVS01047967.1.p1  ORF type:complete len:931 (+),score=193.72 GHVS01047967.1:131-2923(+)